MEATGRYVGAFANAQEWPIPPGKSRASLYLRDLSDPNACEDNLSFGANPIKSLRIDHGTAFVAAGDNSLRVLERKLIPKQNCKSRFREEKRIDLSSVGISIDDMKVELRGKRLLIRSADELMLAHATHGY